MALNLARGAEFTVLFEDMTQVLVRMDSAFYGRGPVHAALAGGAQVSVTVRADARVKAAITSIAEDARTMIEYTDAVFDETSGEWISRAEVARHCDCRPGPPSARDHRAGPRRLEELRVGAPAVRGEHPRTPPGSCSRQSRSTSPAPPPP